MLRTHTDAKPGANSMKLVAPHRGVVCRACSHASICEHRVGPDFGSGWRPWCPSGNPVRMTPQRAAVNVNVQACDIGYPVIPPGPARETALAKIRSAAVWVTSGGMTARMPG